ncbi:hypothetical protein J2S13_001923 [Oikeobacillus pervagus]|uniref:Uncharacterized protein n=1 Tax=Oikeobacillus pervagus TaxID=1325931 RepID=A0AAJ1WJB3_9BACI|nr:hypothetical protein [Oikeobacillus pervagus]
MMVELFKLRLCKKPMSIKRSLEWMPPRLRGQDREGKGNPVNAKAPRRLACSGNRQPSLIGPKCKIKNEKNCLQIKFFWLYLPHKVKNSKEVEQNEQISHAQYTPYNSIF